MIEQLGNQSTSTLLASIVVLLGLQLLKGVGQFVFDIVKKKDEVTESSIKELTQALRQTNDSVIRLEGGLERLEEKVVQFPKMQKDLNLAFSFIKELAGEEEWLNLRKKVMRNSSPFDT